MWGDSLYRILTSLILIISLICPILFFSVYPWGGGDDVHYLLPEGLLGKARVLLKLKRKKEADAILNTVISKYAGTKFEEIAKGYKEKGS